LASPPFDDKVSRLKRKLSEFDTEYLQEILDEDRHHEWTDAAFEAIRQILHERLGREPARRPRMHPQVQEDSHGRDTRKLPDNFDLLLFLAAQGVFWLGVLLIAPIDTDEETSLFWWILLPTMGLILASSLYQILTRRATRPGLKPIEGPMAVLSGIVGAVATLAWITYAILFLFHLLPR
jgi:hypothetical protein